MIKNRSVEKPFQKKIRGILFHEGTKKVTPEEAYHLPESEIRRKGLREVARKAGLMALIGITAAVGASHLRESDKANNPDRISSESNIPDVKLPYHVEKYDNPSSIAKRLAHNPEDEAKIKEQIVSQQGDDQMLHEGEGIQISESLLDNDPKTNPGDNRQ